jgi:hypothetical protein
MKYTTPTNVNEWISYILEEIPNTDLIHQARIAGGSRFIDTLKSEGFDAEAILGIHRAFALRFVRENMRIPSQMENCHVDYNALVLYQDEENIPKED